jgi:hypothetical protein
MKAFPCRFCGQAIDSADALRRHMRKQCYTTSEPPKAPAAPPAGQFAPVPPPLPLDPDAQAQMERAEQTRRAREPWRARWRRRVRDFLWLSNEHRYMYRLVAGIRLDFENFAASFNLWKHSDAVHVNDVERELELMKKRLEFYEREVPPLRRARAAFDAQQPAPIAADGVFVPPAPAEPTSA